MKLLSKLTPAETMLIINPNGAGRKDLLRYTFMNLLLKGVIKTRIEKKKTHTKSKYIKKYTYIVKGKNYDVYPAKLHERVFLTTFLNNPGNIKILVKNVIKVGVENSQDDSFLISKLILKSPDMLPYYKANFFQRFMGTYTLTKEGKKLQSEILTYFKEIDTNMHNLMSDEKKALELLMTIGGNVFLLNNFNIILLEGIDGTMVNAFKEEKAQEKNSKESRWGDLVDLAVDVAIFDYFSDFDSITQGFDGTYDTVEASYSDSGCSSCSGCSGCGGCGGCS